MLTLKTWSVYVAGRVVPEPSGSADVEGTGCCPGIDLIWSPKWESLGLLGPGAAISFVDVTA